MNGVTGVGDLHIADDGASVVGGFPDDAGHDGVEVVVQVAGDYPSSATRSDIGCCEVSVSDSSAVSRPSLVSRCG